MEADTTTAPGGTEALLHQLEWTVLRRLDGWLQGDYRTLMRGNGLDLADLREYQHHDDVRHIDWNVTARLQQPHVRQFSEDRELSAWFLLDLSPSIDFGARVRKRTLSTHFVGAMARGLTRHGNRVGAMLYGSEVDAVIPARGGRRHVLHLLHRLQTRPAAKLGTGTRLADLLHRAAAVIPRRASVFVVSDFISEPGWDQPLAQLARRHDVVAVRLYDPLEMKMPDLGMVLMQDAETGEQMFVDTGARGFRQRFEKIAAEREAALMDGLARAGVDALELSTEDDLADALLRFVDARKQRSRLAAGAVGVRRFA
ncbi:DUF58 domain-containing protein [Aquincola tertiaricarbonis]|uniref:DUF58 domain-containing protein n=1 Tax=Aquincola tertiaricarbonis TaxID=391953 RepID=A0ABY4SGL4_AQUTE|nr:DUF58 domain-containing protein [Aquincola tertiaricarbonis]URI11267.1 DUF58 domain-containing protein [Aquincola tertiaricarbonis]